MNRVQVSAEVMIGLGALLVVASFVIRLGNPLPVLPFGLAIAGTVAAVCGLWVLILTLTGRAS